MDRRGTSGRTRKIVIGGALRRCSADALSDARIANRQAVVDLIQQRRAAAECTAAAEADADPGTASGNNGNANGRQGNGNGRGNNGNGNGGAPAASGGTHPVARCSA